MKQAIYFPWLKGRGGAEKVILETARRSDHETTVFTLFYDPEATFDGFEDVDVRVVGSGEQPRNFLDKGLRFGIGAMMRKLPLEEYDVLLVQEAGIGSLIALRNNDIPVVGYVHTPLRAALPEFYREYRSEKSRAAVPVFDAGIKVYNILENAAWDYFDKVIANSRLTKKRIVDKGLKKEEDVEVVNPGAELVEEQGEMGDYFLYPSRFRRYKRQKLALRAWKRAETADFDLVLAGSSQEEEYLAELRELADDSVEFRLDLPEEEWMDTYRNAYSVLFLAEKEDWGIIPIEAGMHGKPTIAVDEGSPSETVKHGETGFLVDADADEIADRIEELVSSRQKAGEMGEKAREEAEKYSWANFAEKMDEKVEKAVQG
ncbi:MAG: glycosyltransferase [Candidatus Nanohaloarchaea archaeon]